MRSERAQPPDRAAARSSKAGALHIQRRRALQWLSVSGTLATVTTIGAAQTTAHIGYLGTNRNTPLGESGYRAFIDEMRRAGFVEGKNLVVEFGVVNQSSDALARQAAVMVRSGAQLMVTDGTEVALRAALTARADLPIVMLATNFDPVQHGYAETLARPGHNVTGVFLRQIELAEKQTELLHQAVPEATRMAILWDAISEDQLAAARQRADALGLRVHTVKLEQPPYDFDAAFRAVSAPSPQALLVLPSPNFTAARARIAALAIERRLPTMFIFKTYVHAGGLMSYGADFEVMHRQAAGYVVKILAGAKPAELPIEQPDKFELAVNLKTARALGRSIPPALLLRADDVIQ